MEGFANSVEHLLAELGRLELMLQQQVLWLRAANLLTEDDAYRGLYIPDAQIDALFSPKYDIGATPSAGGDILTQTQELTSLIEQIRLDNADRVKASPKALALPRLAQLFHLSPVEVDVLLICVAPELDLGYETFYGYVQNDITKKRPSVDLALKLLFPTLEDRIVHTTLFAPNSPLLRHYLIRLFDDPQDRKPPLLGRFMKADQRIIDFLLDRDNVDEKLVAFTEVITPSQRLTDLALPETLINQLSQASRSLETGSLAQTGGVFFFQGPYGVGKQAAVEAVCTELDYKTLVIANLGGVLAADVSLPTILSLLQREATLQEAALYLTHSEVLLADEKQLEQVKAVLGNSLAQFDAPIFMGSETIEYPVGLWPNIHFLNFEFPPPTFLLRRRLWGEALNYNSQPPEPTLDLAALANKFRLNAGQIRDAVHQAANLAAIRTGNGNGISMDDLHSAARSQSRQGLRRLAQKIEPVYTWSDIVLPLRAMQQLREVHTAVKYRHIVYSRWGFDQKLALGKGLNALFAGPSGTGKTMAAGILAGALQLDLYKIDLSSVVSKYIGETEKNLDRIFNEAKASNAILFFDEADALFGKRSEVKDAHDRYANIEVAYLLQKMEEYDGIVILATNLHKNLDEAFSRRMHHVVEFPAPDAVHRERIWQGIFPDDAPLADDVDLRFLARQFELTGGNIRNVALAAAFMAASAESSTGTGSRITMEHLILAIARELQKIGKLPSKASFRQYYELIRERG